MLDDKDTQPAIASLEQSLKEGMHPALENFFSAYVGEDGEVPIGCLRIFIMTLAKMLYDSFYVSSFEVPSDKQEEFRQLIGTMLTKMMVESDMENVTLYLPKERWMACFQKSQSQTSGESNI